MKLNPLDIRIDKPLSGEIKLRYLLNALTGKFKGIKIELSELYWYL